MAVNLTKAPVKFKVRLRSPISGRDVMSHVYEHTYNNACVRVREIMLDESGRSKEIWKGWTHEVLPRTS